MLKPPKLGEIFLCIKDTRMELTNELVYIKGKFYRSDYPNCITDENGEKYHYWDDTDWTLYFIKFNHKKNSLFGNNKNNLYFCSS